jgi:halocyanin-like protein
MKSPLDSPEGDWWSEKVNRRETIWLGISGAWALTLFGWMAGWTQFGEQNQVGETLKVAPEDFQTKVTEYADEATESERGLVPPGEDVYVGAFRYAFDGLPAVLETGTEYRFHLGTYDVQHGFSVRKEDTLSKQLSLQMLPGYEWILPMEFDEPGTYHVVCNEFCGEGHRTMHGKFEVVTDLSAVEPADDAGEGSDGSGDSVGAGDYGGWFTDAQGGETANYDGEAADATGQDAVTVTVGPDGNFTFDPPAVQVSSGTTVTFEWASNTHNVLVESQPDGADWGGHEAIENDGFSFEHTFETEGVYKYYCDPHLGVGMKGVVEVA